MMPSLTHPPPKLTHMPPPPLFRAWPWLPSLRTLELGGQFVLLGSGHCDGDFKKLAATDFANNPDCK